MSRQFFDLRPGETLRIGTARVTLEVKSGQRARLRVESDETTAVERSVARPQVAPPQEPAVPMLPRPRFAG